MTRDSEAEPMLEEGPALGSTVGGKYVIEALLGRGGMGAVYRARHLVTGRRVAIKWLLDANESLRQRFLREARAMGFIEHESVVSVLDVSDHEGAAFIVMELLRGQSLRDFIGSKPQSIHGTVTLLMPALEGLAAVHKAGIVHRDLKPDNVFVCQDAAGNVVRTKLLDLGVARLRTPSQGERDDLTVSGAIVGTPRYMSPEQLRGLRDIDARADIFALGLILYEMLTARLPYDASTYESLVIDIVTSDPPSPRVFRPEIPDALAAVVLKALARDREKRFPDVESLARALEPYAEGIRFTPPTEDNVRGSYVPEPLSAEDVVSLPTIEQTPRKSREPTPNLRGVRPSPATVVPIRRALDATRVSETEIADTASNASAVTLPVKSRGPSIALGVLVLLGVATAAFLLTQRETERETEPPAAEAAPAPAPREAPPTAPIVTPPAPASAEVVPAAPTEPAVNEARPRRPSPRTETVIAAPPPAMQEPAPTEMRSGRPVIEVDQF